MKQTIIFERPPIFDKIAKKFDIIGKPIIFAWGDRIYNPERIDIPKELLAHESVHGERQVVHSSFSRTDERNILAWWDRYIDDPKFRFDEELPAHKAEFLALIKRHSDKRAVYLKHVAEKLAAPLYGNLVTVQEAAVAILTTRIA